MESGQLDRELGTDAGGFRLPWGRRHALLVVLGYSRLLWLRLFQRQTNEHVRSSPRALTVKLSG